MIARLLGGPEREYHVPLPAPGEPKRAILDSYTKEHSAEYQSQAPIDLARRLRQRIGDLDQVAAIMLHTSNHTHVVIGTGSGDPQKFDPDASRETLDHSLPYIVAAAVLDGFVRTDSFAPSRVLEPARQKFVAEKVKAAPEAALGTIAGGKHKRHEAGYLGRVEIELADGTVVHGEAKPFPGHPKNPFSDADLAGKLKENMEPFAGTARSAKLAACLGSIETLAHVRDLTALLALPESSGVDNVTSQ